MTEEQRKYAALIDERDEFKSVCEAALMARGWFEGHPSGALEEIETRARTAIANAERTP